MRKQEQPATDAGLIWERPEPPSRVAPEHLSRARIVDAAIAIADKEGIGCVSLRKVGASLNAGPMRLYGYIETKEELLELMVDVVYGEMMSTELSATDWRGALHTMAHRMRSAGREHKWFVSLLGGRPNIGPRALAYLEAALAAICESPGFENVDAAMQAFHTVNAYVVGALQSEAGELSAELASHMTESEWHAATGPYIQRMISTGHFPSLSKVIRNATHPSADIVFDRGLSCVLDGIECIRGSSIAGS